MRFRIDQHDGGKALLRASPVQSGSARRIARAVPLRQRISGSSTEDQDQSHFQEFAVFRPSERKRMPPPGTRQSRMTFRFLVAGRERED